MLFSKSAKNPAYAFIFLIALVLTLVTACKDNSLSGTDTDVDTNTMAESTTEELPYADLPEKTFDGAEFKLMQWYRGVNHNHNYFEYYVEEQNGEILNDTIFDRNRKIEEQYDIVIVADGEESPTDVCVKLINAGDFYYHFYADIPQRLAKNSVNGYFYKINTVPYIDLEAPWWNERALEGFSIGGNLYILTGDYVLYEKERTFGTIFNRDLADSYSIPNLYETAANGMWTVDLMNKYSNDVSSDLNGDGKMTHTDDQFGLYPGSYTYISALLFGMGNRFSSKDANDLPVLSAINEHMISSIDKLGNVIFSDDVTWGETVTDNWSKPRPQSLFEEGRALFHYEVLQVTRLLETDISYGIIPSPKYDEAQSEYLTTVQYPNSGAIAIPTNNPEIEMTGILLEALAAESHYTTFPTFIDIILKTKKAPDELAPLMLDVIFSGIEYDIAEAFDFGGITAIFNRELYQAGYNNVISNYATKETLIQTELNNTVEQYLSIEDR